MQVCIPCVANEFSPTVPVPTFIADSLEPYGVYHVQPLCAVACIDVFACINSPKQWQSYHCLDTQKYCTHWLVGLGVGGAALAGDPNFPQGKGQCNTKKATATTWFIKNKTKRLSSLSHIFQYKTIICESCYQWSLLCLKVKVCCCDGFSSGLNFVPPGHLGTVYLPFSLRTGQEDSYRGYTDSLDTAVEGKQTVNVMICWLRK